MSTILALLNINTISPYKRNENLSCNFQDSSSWKAILLGWHCFALLDGKHCPKVLYFSNEAMRILLLGSIHMRINIFHVVPPILLQFAHTNKLILNSPSTNWTHKKKSFLMESCKLNVSHTRTHAQTHTIRNDNGKQLARR